MKTPQELNQVTPFSKILTLLLFILLPFMGFYLGIRYKKSSSAPLPPNLPIEEQPTEWSSYTNTTYGFSMKVPSYMLHTPGDPIESFTKGELTQCCGYEGPNLSIVIFPRGSWTNDPEPSDQESTFIIAGETVKKLSGLAGVRIGPLTRGGYTYKFLITGKDKTEDDFKDIYDMLRSFDVSILPTLPPSTPVPLPTLTSNWQWHGANEVDVEFPYPPTWIIKETNTKEQIKQIIHHQVLQIMPQSSQGDYYPSAAIQLSYYDNPRNLSIQDFNNQYLSKPVAGDPVSIWSSSYEKKKNPQGIEMYYDAQHYCVDTCQIFVWKNQDKIWILKNFPTDAENQTEIFRAIASGLTHSIKP